VTVVMTAAVVVQSVSVTAVKRDEGMAVALILIMTVAITLLLTAALKQQRYVTLHNSYTHCNACFCNACFASYAMICTAVLQCAPV
jgi:hypothetical protein